MTLLERIRAAQGELRDTDVSPARACELLTRLTADLGNCNTELRESDIAYKKILLSYRRRYETAAEARMWADGEPEYGRFQEAKHVKEETVEMIRSLKSYLRTMEEEMRLSK